MWFFLGIPKKKKNETKTLSNPFKQQRRHCVYEGDIFLKNSLNTKIALLDIHRGFFVFLVQCRTN